MMIQIDPADVEAIEQTIEQLSKDCMNVAWGKGSSDVYVRQMQLDVEMAIKILLGFRKRAEAARKEVTPL